MTQLENQFLNLWKSLYPFIGLVSQYKFSPDRRYKADFAHIESLTLVEIQGGIWSNTKMGHNSGSGLERDYDKLCQAQIEGWAVFFISSNMIKEEYIDKIATTIKNRYLRQFDISHLRYSPYAYIISNNQCIRLRKSIKDYSFIWIQDKIVKKAKNYKTLEKAANTLSKKRKAPILSENTPYIDLNY